MNNTTTTYTTKKSEKKRETNKRRRTEGWRKKNAVASCSSGAGSRCRGPLTIWWELLTSLSNYVQRQVDGYLTSLTTKATTTQLFTAT